MNEDKVSIKTPEFVSLQFQLAGLGSRAAAFMIDQLILIVINILIVVSAVFIVGGQENLMSTFDSATVTIAIVIILIFVINGGYFFAFEYFTGGQTIGKKRLGIRVIQENGHSITLLSSFIRNLLRIIDLLPASYFVGIVMIFIHSQHKRVGDVVAGTIVVHERGRKKSKKLSELEKEINLRNLSKDDLIIDDWTLKSLGIKEWRLLQAYSERFLHLPLQERNELTSKLANVLLVKVGIEAAEKNYDELENLLLLLYLRLKDEWEYDL